MVVRTRVDRMRLYRGTEVDGNGFERFLINKDVIYTLYRVHIILYIYIYANVCTRIVRQFRGARVDIKIFTTDEKS